MSEQNTDVQKTSEEQVQELQQALAKEQADKANLVEEIKAEREKKRLAQEELEKARTTTPTNDDVKDPEVVVARVLERREQEASKQAFEDAKKEVRNLYNEFSAETDAAGIVFGKFEKELTKFNFSDLKTKQDIVDRMKEVYEFSKRSTQTDVNTNFYTGTRKDGSNVRTVDGNALSDAESKLIKELGWATDRFLKVKEKRPAYVASLLKSRANS